MDEQTDRWLITWMGGHIRPRSLYVHFCSHGVLEQMIVSIQGSLLFDRYLLIIPQRDNQDSRQYTQMFPDRRPLKFKCICILRHWPPDVQIPMQEWTALSLPNGQCFRLPIHPFDRPTGRLTDQPAIHPFVRPTDCLSVRLSICLSVRLIDLCLLVHLADQLAFRPIDHMTDQQDGCRHHRDVGWRQQDGCHHHRLFPK